MYLPRDSARYPQWSAGAIPASWDGSHRMAGSRRFAWVPYPAATIALGGSVGRARRVLERRGLVVDLDCRVRGGFDDGFGFDFVAQSGGGGPDEAAGFGLFELPSAV